VTRKHRASHRLLQAQLQPDVEIAQPRAGLAQLVLDHLAYTGAFLHHDQGLIPELLERHRLTREPMTRRNGEHDLVAEEGLERDAAMAAPRTDDAELELAVGDARHDRLRVGDVQSHVHVGLTLRELAQEHGHDAAAGPRRRAELEHAADRPLVIGLELLEQLLLELQEPLRGGVEPEPGLGRLHPAARPVEQLPAQALLKRADLQADGGLGDAEPLGSLREALALDDGAECGELTRVHKRSLCLRRRLYDPDVASDSLTQRFSDLTEASPARPRDAVLRTLDIGFSTIFLLVSLPLTVPLAVLVVATSGLPLFYRGERVGRGGRVFEMLKFRSLKPGAEDRLGPFLGEELVRRTQAETTAVGGWLRATQLDEIPQLLNVLRGDMSLVGPRPIRPRFFEELAAQLPAYWQRLVVRPGLTGFAQVRRGYETSMAEKLAHDLEWIADRSVRLYLRTLATTVIRVLRQFLRGLVPTNYS
jgi:lipopolysaccharide/colanic/teichoic acid biosynthesis glycosyltransferase